MTVKDATQNARIAVASYKATQTTLERRQRDKDHFKALYEKAAENYSIAYKDTEAAREAVSAAKHQLFEAIEAEAF